MRKIKAITSSSSDKDIMNLIQTINAKGRGYYNAKDLDNEQKEALGDQFMGRVQNLLSYRNTSLPLSEANDGRLFIPKKKESVDYIRSVLKKQEEFEAAQKAIDSSFTRNKTLAENLQELKTYTEKIKSIQDDLAKDTYTPFSDAVLRKPEKGMTKEQKQDIKRLNRDAAIKEAYARATHAWEKDDKFEDVIDKLYAMGDLNGANEVISELQTGKWTGDLMERANVVAYGYEYESEA